MDPQPSAHSAENLGWPAVILRSNRAPGNSNALVSKSENRKIDLVRLGIAKLLTINHLQRSSLRALLRRGFGKGSFEFRLELPPPYEFTENAERVDLPVFRVFPRICNGLRHFWGSLPDLSFDGKNSIFVAVRIECP